MLPLRYKLYRIAYTVQFGDIEKLSKGTNFILALLFSLGFYNMFFILRPILYDDPDMVGRVGVYDSGSNDTLIKGT